MVGNKIKKFMLLSLITLGLESVKNMNFNVYITLVFEEQKTIMEGDGRPRCT
jgi:hypothetical protein